jgi:hypothetical protein
MLPHLTPLGTIHTVAALLAIAVEELIVRSAVVNHAAAWAVSGAATGVVTLIGAILVRRHQPTPVARDMAMTGAMHNSGGS